MSFTTDVKSELIKHYTKAAHCRVAELSAMMFLEKDASSDRKGDRYILGLDNMEAARKCYTTISKTLGFMSFKLGEYEKKQKNGDLYYINTENEKEADVLSLKTGVKDLNALKDLLKKSCCKRAFLRGAFISTGSITDPEKNYHFEISCEDEEKAELIATEMQSFSVHPKISKRRNRYVVYLKEGLEIVEMLNVMEAHRALMDYENARIVREMRGNVNRKVNCETANIGKTIDAAFKQIEDINYINEKAGLDSLEPSLYEIANARLENPDMSLAALGEVLSPPIGKSGVNHRLRKISQIAEGMRKKERN